MREKHSFPVDYSERIKVIGRLRVALATVKHHAGFGKRVVDRFAASLPEYHVWARAGSSFYGLNVKGGTVDLTLSWLHGPWAQSMAEELDRQDPTDAAERQSAEVELMPALLDIEARILALQTEAANLIKALPIPPSATLRKEPHFWDGPLSGLQDMYPAAFAVQGRR